jgi:hypothetical protein
MDPVQGTWPIASDGQLESIHEVTVTVNPGGSVQNR